MSYDGKINTDQWYPVRLASGSVPLIGVPSGDLSVYYGYEAETNISSYVLGGGNWVETGSGMYWLQIGSSEFTSAGKYQIYIYSGGMDAVYLDIEAKTYTIEDIGNYIYNVSGNVVSNNTYLQTISGYTDTLEDVLGTVSGNVTTINNTVDSISGNLTVVDGVVDSISGITAAIPSGVWQEARSDHVASGTFGQSLQIMRNGTAQGGTSANITLDSAASATNDYYNDCIVHIIGGTGAYQSRRISDYNGGTQVATVATSWATNPDATSVFVIRPASDTITTLTAASVSDIVTSGDAAGWADGATAAEVWASASGVNVTGIEPAALSQIVTSGEAAGWDASSNVGAIVTGIFDELVMSGNNYDFRTVTRDMWAYAAQQVDISGIESGVVHTYYDDQPAAAFELTITASGRTRTDL